MQRTRPVDHDGRTRVVGLPGATPIPSPSLPPPDGPEGSRGMDSGRPLSLPSSPIYAQRHRSIGARAQRRVREVHGHGRPPIAVAVALILGLAEGPVLAQGQQAGRVYRIGVLDGSSLDAASARIESFRKGLRDLGHIEGQNLKIEWLFAEGKEAALPTLATELAGLKPDVLVSSTAWGLWALRNATTAIPIVAAGADTDAGTQLVNPENLGRPIGNITGVISTGRETDGKRMELLHEAVPAVARVVTFWDCSSRNIGACRPGWQRNRGLSGGDSPSFRSRCGAPMISRAPSPRRSRKGREPSRSRTLRCSTRTAGDWRISRSRIGWPGSPETECMPRRGA
jgi:ABC transporter substrate binding protein